MSGASNKTTSYEATANKATSNKMTPNRTAMGRTTTDRTTTDRTTTDRTTTDRTTTDRTTTNAFRDSVLAGCVALRTGPLSWLNGLRGAALEAAHSLTLPGKGDEDWRFTDLSSLYRLAFKTLPTPALPRPGALEEFLIPEAACRLVFVDGVFAPTLSSMVETADLAATDLRRALETDPEHVRAHLAALSSFKEDAFVAINTAYLQDAAVLTAKRNHAVPSPVHILFVSTQAEAAVHPRVLVTAEEGAELTVVEDHVALHGGLYCVNAVTEVTVGANARVRHVKLQRESGPAYHIAACNVAVGRDGAFHSHSVATGARISRFNLTVRQTGEGARMSANGLALLDEHQVADTHSFFDHGAPNGASRQMHKTVLSGNSHAVFNGRILVRPGAQRTDSAQQSRNLLLSDRARIDTKPQLEIFADDVKCSHGATVGQLETEELFYLRSRGLPLREARNLLTYGFAAQVIDGVPVPSLVKRLRHAVLARTAAKDYS